MSLRKLMDFATGGIYALARKNPPSTKKGSSYSLKNIANQLRIKDTLNWKGTTPERKVEEKEKKKKKTTKSDPSNLTSSVSLGSTSGGSVNL